VNKIDLLEKFKEFDKSYYTFAELQILLGLEKMSTNKRIIDLVKDGFLIKLAKNIYVPAFWGYDTLRIANDLNQPSYISFETALSYHGVLKSEDEIVTLASFLGFPRRDVAGKTIIWSKIKRELFWGFEKKDNIMLATPAKAFLDLVYLASFGRGTVPKEQISFSNLDKENIFSFIEKYPKQTISYFNKEYKPLIKNGSL
jgi:predicted transcriptional regulator of viral defense system